MSEHVVCPDCGRSNDAAAAECANCGFPLIDAPGLATARASSARAEDAPPARETAADASSKATPAPAPGDGGPPLILRRPRQRPPRPDQTPVTLWLVFGTICALAVVWVALKANFDHPTPPVEGADAGQQASADSLVRLVERDSTNVDARHALADVLFDTGNWPDAIVQYRAVVRMDSTRVPAMVDLGVCYFNLSDAPAAEQLFRLALARDPHQPVALFDLGILYESRKDWNTALRYYHQALQSSPPPKMQQTLQDHLMSAMKQSGTMPPPLPDGRK